MTSSSSETSVPHPARPGPDADDADAAEDTGCTGAYQRRVEGLEASQLDDEMVATWLVLPQLTHRHDRD